MEFSKNKIPTGCKIYRVFHNCSKKIKPNILRSLGEQKWPIIGSVSKCFLSEIQPRAFWIEVKKRVFLKKKNPNNPGEWLIFGDNISLKNGCTYAMLYSLSFWCIWNNHSSKTFFQLNFLIILSKLSTGLFWNKECAL